jgi:hypothetical protein
VIEWCLLHLVHEFTANPKIYLDMKSFWIPFLLLTPFCGLAQNREVESYTEKLVDLMELFQANISSEDKCEELWRDVQDYKEEIDEFKSKGEFSRADSEMLSSLSNAADILDDYFICVGGWNSFPIKKGRFFKASELFNDVKISYIHKGVYCVDIIEYKLDNFIAYFAVNNTARSYTVSYSFRQKYGEKSGNMGLASGMIRLMIDNREGVISNYKIENITCQEF